MQTIKKIVAGKYRNIVVLCMLFICVAGLAIWFCFGKSDPVIDLREQETPLDGIRTKIIAGDTVVVNIFADEMDSVYSYQFDINYDRDFLEYNKRVYSDIDEILTIFASDKEWRLIVGATMIGEAKGYSGRKVSVCQLEFGALVDFELNHDSTSDHMTISSVNIVKDDLQYLEDVDGWTINIAANSRYTQSESR